MTKEEALEKIKKLNVILFMDRFSIKYVKQTFLSTFH